MAYPVVYGKTKLSSAVAGEAIADAGDLNYAVHKISLTDDANSVFVPQSMSSFYAVSRTGTLATAPSQVDLPLAWFLPDVAQRDGRNTGWRVRFHFSGVGSLVIMLSEKGVIMVQAGDLVDIIYAPALVDGGVVINGREANVELPEFIIHFLHKSEVS